MSNLDLFDDVHDNDSASPPFFELTGLVGFRSDGDADRLSTGLLGSRLDQVSIREVGREAGTTNVAAPF